MMVLITGGSACGKSHYAEDLAVRLAGADPLIYMAAMKPYGAESERRIARHRAQRAGRGFTTVEAYTDIDRAVRFNGHEKSTVLLECLPNLLANELFDDDGGMHGSEATAEKVFDELMSVSAAVRNFIIITNETGSDGIDYESATEEYVRILAELGRSLSDKADTVTEVVYTVPVFLKGDKWES